MYSGCNIGDKVPFSGIDPVWKFTNLPYLQPDVSSKNYIGGLYEQRKKEKAQKQRQTA